jgi:hypothetical protein
MEARRSEKRKGDREGFGVGVRKQTAAMGLCC